MTIENIAHTLRYLDAPRSFAARRFASAKNLLLSVRRLGPIALPIDRATAKDLISQAKPSPFGLRDKTLRDPEVRSSWEIEGKRVRLGREWMQTLHAKLDDMREELQLPEASELKVELDKLLIYERGQFFLPHQDSEKCDGMIGSLVVVLPSDYDGGDVVVEHQSERVEFRRRAGFSVDEIVRLAGDMAKGRSAEALSKVHTALAEHAIRGLRKALAKPERKEGDWSLRVDLSCSCDLCQELSRFLAKKGQSRLLWPLAKDGRAHVHSAIDNHCLPVEHVTHRQGRPYTLVLTKSPALLEREAAQRKAWKAQLRQMERQSAQWGAESACPQTAR
jgi:hypothetical protein